MYTPQPESKRNARLNDMNISSLKLMVCSVFGFSPLAVLAAGLVVSPATITNDYIIAAGTGTPLGGAMVVLLPPNGGPVAGTVTDANGNYTLYSPPGNYTVLPLKSGYIADFNAANVSVVTNQFATVNVTNLAATRNLAGKVRDTVGGAGLAGVFVQAQSTVNQFAANCSDSAGNFALPVVAGQWSVKPSAGLAQLGYVGWKDGLTANASSGSVSNLNLDVPKATALIYGTIKDDLNNPLPGIGLWTDDTGNTYEPSGLSFPTNANYCVGVTPGNWWIQPDNDVLHARGYLGQGTNVSLATNQAVQVNFSVHRATARLAGRVVDNTGTPVSDASFGASDQQGTDNYLNTDGSGNFDLAVVGGIWHLNLSTDDARQRGLLGPDMVITLTNGQARTNILYVAQRTTAQISGQVQDDVGNPLGGLWVSAWVNLGGTNYDTRAQTDSNGYYQVGVINGPWNMGLDCSDLQNRGYECVNSGAITVAGASRVMNFTVPTAPDMTPPTLVASSPNNNAAAVPVNTTLAFTFSEPMQSEISISFNENAPANWTAARSADQRTLTVAFGALLPANAVVAWTLNPSSSWLAFMDLAGNSLPADVSGQFTTAPPNPPGPDVTFFVISKGQQDYVQTNAVTAPALQGSTPWRFGASVNLAASGTVTSATVRAAGGSVYALTPGSMSLDFTAKFATQSALDATFPGGAYTLTMNTANDGMWTVTYNLSGNAYPTTPHISNFAATQAVNPNNDFLITWDAFSGGTTNDYIQFQLNNGNGSTVSSTPPPGQPGALNGTQTSWLIPHGLVPAGQTNQGRLMFAKAMVSDATNYPGALGLAAYYKRTTFNLVATGPRETTPPALVSTSPAEGATSVATNAVVAFTFNEPMLSDYSISWMGAESYNFSYTWTADQKTLVCVYAGEFPPNTAIGWTLNPSGGGGSGFRDVSGNSLPFDTYTGSFTTGTTMYGRDVNYYVVGKYQTFFQTNTAAPVLYTNQPYFFFSFVYPFSAFGLVNATVTLPGGGSRNLLPFGYLDFFGFTDSFASQSALNAAYPTGNYKLSISAAHEGIHSAMLPLGLDAYPNPPRVSNYTAAQAVNPAADFALTWDAMIGGTANDYTQVRIYDAQTDDEVFATPPASYAGALNGLETATVIPRFTLAPNHDYRALVFYAKVTTTNLTDYPGTPGLVAFDTENRFLLHTVNPPLAWDVTPSSVTGDYAGGVKLSITGLSNGQPVLVEKFLDANTNGVIEAGEMLMQRFTLQDGQATLISGVRNPNVPGDDDGAANGMIRAAFTYKAQSEANLAVGQYLYRVSPDGGGFAPLTARFTVTQPAYVQKIVGRVTCGGSPVSQAFAFLITGPDQSPAATALADLNGFFTFNCPPGSYGVLALKSGYLFNFNTPSNVTVAAGLTVTQNVAMLASDRTISGRLIEATNGPGLAGVQVFCQADNGLSTLGMTDSGGNFSLPVSTGDRFWQISASRADAAARNCLALDDDPRVDTSAGNVSNLVIQWPQATALLYGNVRDDRGQPVSGVHVDAGDLFYFGQALTDANGDYAMGVIAGIWRFGFTDADLAALGLAEQRPGPTITAVNGQAYRVDLVVRRDTARLRGRVVDRNSGQPLPGMQVTVNLVPDNSWNWVYLGSSVTDTNGEYLLPVPPGSNYIVLTEAAGMFYFRQYWNNVWDRQQATLLTVAEGATVSNLDFALEPGGRISGFVRRQDDLSPIYNCHVYAVDDATGGWVEGANTDAAGRYSMVVPAGTYRVGTCPDCAGLTYVSEWYDGAHNQGDGVPVVVTVSQETAGIDFGLEVGGVISGRVFQEDAVTGLANCHVFVTDYDSNAWMAGGFTDASGAYSLRLPAGAYRVRAFPAERGLLYESKFYDNTYNYASAGQVLVTNSLETGSINFTLAPAGTISGHIYAEDGFTPVANCHIGAEDYATGEWMAWNNTDQNGSYTLVLPQGFYRVVARPSNNGQPYLDEYYNDVFDRNRAVAVPVTVPNDTPHIDFALQPPSYIRGRVVDQNSGQPLPGVRVNGDMIPDPSNFFWNWMHLGSAETDRNGEYALPVPPGRNYIVQADPEGTLYFRQCWSNVWYREQSTLLTVADGATVSNINFELALGGRISGTVRRQSDLSPIFNCHVYAENYATGAWEEGRNSDAAGHYDLVVPAGTYRVRACPECSGLAYFSQWYNGTDNSGDSVPVVATVSQETIGIDFRLLSELPQILTSGLPSRQVNLPYTNVTLAASGGMPPYTWSVAAGELPPGLSLDSASGAFDGAPATAGRFDFTVRVTDSFAQTATQPLGISVYPTPPGFPIANEMAMEVLNGIATDGSNYLVCIQIVPAPKPITVQLISSNGTLLNGRISLGRTGGRAVAAYDGTNYLVVWEDSSDDLYGQFISRSGALVRTNFAVSSAAGKQTLDSPKSLAFDGTNYLVVWNDSRDPNDTDGYGQLIAPSGALVGGEIPLSTQSGNLRSIVVAFGATNYLAVWMNQRQTGVETYDVWGRFVSRSGVAGSLFQISQTSSPRSYSVRAAYNGTNLMVVWNRDASGGVPNSAVWEVWGRVVTPAGTFVGNEFAIASDGVTSFNYALVGRAGGNFLASWFQTSGATAASQGRLLNSTGGPVGTLLNFGGMCGPRAGYAIPVYESNRCAVFSFWVTWQTNASAQITFPNGDCYGQFLPLTPARLDPLGWSRLGTGQLQFRLGVTGTQGRTVTLQASRDLITWTDLQTTGDGTVQVSDLMPDAPGWFFRTVIK